MIRQSIPDATLHILGAGPYESKLRSLVQTLCLEHSVTIEFISPGNRLRMAESLCEASVFALLSEYEANPVAIMEALTLGVPAVGLDTAGIGDLVSDGLVTGVPRDATPATIAQTLVTALHNRRAIGATTLPTWDTAAADLGRIYLDAVGADSKPHCWHDA